MSLTITKTDLGVVLTISGMLTGKQELNDAIGCITTHADLTSMATMKEHYASVKDAEGKSVKTDEVVGNWLAVQGRLPGAPLALTFDGEKFYTKHLAYTLSGFNLEDSEYATTTPAATPAKAASISAADIKAQMKARREAELNKAAASPKPGDVVAVNPAH